MKNLIIKNFKGFNDLEINGFNKVTLLSGMNHIGKSSVLEAILLLYNYPLAAQLIPYIIKRNKAPQIDFMETAYLFHDHLYQQPIEISTNGLKMTINYLERYDYQVPMMPQQPVPLSISSEAIAVKCSNSSEVMYEGYGVNYPQSNNLYVPLQRTIKQSASLPEIIMIDERGQMLRNTDLLPLGTQSSTTVAVQEFDKIRIDQEKFTQLVEILQLIDKDVESVEIGVRSYRNPSNAVMSQPSLEIRKAKLAKPLPLSSFGTGMNRLFNIIVGIINYPNSIILIDELENGLHYSLFKELWKTFFALSRQQNCQIIATTHSWELASYVAEDQTTDNRKDDFAFIKLSPGMEQLSASCYSYDTFKTAIASNFEIR